MRHLNRSKLRACLLAAALCAPAAVVTSVTGVADASHGRFANFEPRTARDLDPRPDVVEVDLTAEESSHSFRPGSQTTIWGYDGALPGPVIRAEIGDEVVVNFCNELPPEAGPTIVHFHGIEAIAAMDGSNISQAPIARGDCFEYLLRPLTAATYWYHTHFNSNVQIEHGLSGTLVVSDRAEDARLGLPKAAVALLDDVLLDDDNQIAPEEPSDPEANAKQQLDGREGNVLLVNGQSDRVLEARAGEPLRIRFVNGANARFMRLSFPGQDEVWRVGGDAGLIGAPEPIEPIHYGMHGGGHGGGHAMMSDPDPDKGLLITPGERAEVVINPQGQVGDLIPVQWHDFPRGRHNPVQNDDGGWMLSHDHMDGMAPPQTLFTIQLRPGYGPGWTPPSTLRPVEPIDPTGAAKLFSTFGHGMPSAEGDVTFFAQSSPTQFMGMPFTPKPFPAVTPADAQDVSVGETRVWEITNLTGSDHPFHAHGFFFQPLEVQYMDMDNPANNVTVPFDTVETMDTVRLPGRPGAMGRSRTVLRAVSYFGDEGREGDVFASGKTPAPGHSGGWVFHCHIFEHVDRGMMSFIEVK